ncbi:ABC transporter ATP-binding protein [Nocardioides cavernaquae]|uniref:ABC transporter ATP-binding protein n=1 Tax=Nocardioides cavernaquae TaxID=2321396 RepID=A0A3A5HA38_9ACTN|nr:ABC transporter ATP-binding protein [Nocardioides cavernaquae]RJS46255.1 ABC transporter ATP-binding protein [Nocardioides cavernaquae]
MADIPLGRPSLIVDDVHVDYRTYGGRRLGPRQSRLLRHVGTVDVVQAVRGVSFVARHGESIGVVGHNGSGKSTLMRAIAGSQPLKSGAIWTDGSAALLGVNAALMRDLSGEQNIRLGGLALGQTRGQVAASYDEVADFAGIGEFLHLPMRTYSAGMGARLRFAISSAARPDILLIDEALATGDAEFRRRSERRIEEIRAQAGTVLLVSHQLSHIREMCDRVLWIHRGELLADGPTAEVLERYAEVTSLPAKRRAGA